MQGSQRQNAKSHEREHLDREMLMTLQAQPGYLNTGKVRNQSQQQTIKQNYSNKLKNPTAGKADLAASADDYQLNMYENLRVEIQGTQVDIAELPEDVQ